MPYDANLVVGSKFLIYLHILFLSVVGVQAALELEDDEDNGGFAKLVGGGGWIDEIIADCAATVILDGILVSYEGKTNYS